MEISEERIDEAVLALLWLTLHDQRRAWKNFDFDAIDRLFSKGMIEDPTGESKSLILTDEGLAQSKLLFERLFTQLSR